MNISNTSVEFSFNNTMYKQTDGIAMGSLLGPVLANTLGGYREIPVFQTNQKAFLYQKFVDDIFATFPNEAKCDEFFAVLNSLHPSRKRRLAFP